MNTDILFQNLSENPAFNTPVAEKTINEIKILDLRYTEEIDIIFMTSHVAKVKYGKKFNPNNSKQILSIIAPCFNYGGIIDKEGNILLTEELTKKIKEQTVEIGENSLISDSPNKIVDSLEKELETKISAMAVNSCASVKFGFDVSRKDKNGEEKKKNISYKISLNMADISAMKGLKLYHQKENGDMEELTFTAGSDENGGQKVELQR